MLLRPLSIFDSLNRGYVKQSLKRLDIDLFKTELTKVFSHIDENQDEDYHKNLISDFLKTVYYKDKHLINVNKTQDLAIRIGNSPQDEVGVLLEFKKPSSSSEMISIQNPNSKSFQQLILYYLRERIDKQNHSIKHLIITDLYQWYIFDELWFEKNIYRDTQFIKQYQEYQLSGHDTRFFYQQIAAKYIANSDIEIPCTYFNLKDYQDLEETPALLNLYKIFSPEHLLKLPFANDSNTLNRDFYNELLHIIGIEEVKTGSVHTIVRKQKNRHEGSLIENAIQICTSRNKLKEVQNVENLDEDEFIYSIGLELCITWLNRILFLKLLEGQLVKYHKSNRAYFFLHSQKIKDFNELDELFFDVLAIPVEKRMESVQEKFGNLPYLNSSLFEVTDLENNTIRISDLKFRHQMPLYSATVLKDASEKQKTGAMNTLQYLFEFLSSYNFASDDTAEIQEENKTIISASVLGLIFEKLNGYKDGAFFTPGFITMYICLETLKLAVVQKFKDSNLEGFKNLQSFEELKDKLDYSNKEVREKANTIINSIKICDPAVGSGHFLVSALNEMIALKSELQILNYKDGRRIRGVDIKIENDELIITDQETNELFSYHISDKNTPIKEIQDLQEAIFNEKRNLIENCLFGVDINSKSVSICRLRLWIELLKHTYYKFDTSFPQLETLPNIDINIKIGNSLISRFDKKFNIFEKNIITEKVILYKSLVDSYKQLKDYQGKDKLREQIDLIKTQLSDIAIPIDTDFAKIRAKQRELDHIMRLPNHYELKVNLAKEIEDLNTEYAIKIKTLYRNSFEWFLAFPEVISEDGDYQGFDVVVGNPPYVQVREFSEQMQKAYQNSKYYPVAKGSRLNLFQFFIPLAYDILKPNGFNTLVYQNSFLAEDSTQNARTFVFENQKIIHIDSFPERDNENLRAFKEAKMSICLTFCQKTLEPDYKFTLRTWKDNTMSVNKSIEYTKNEIQSLSKGKWIIPMLSKHELDLFTKINSINDRYQLRIFSGELDMTAAKPFFTKEKKYPLIVKGAQVQRYFITEKVSQGEVEYLDTDRFFKENKKEGRLADFQKERIVMQRITGVDSPIRLIMTIIPNSVFCANSTNYITDTKKNLRYILGVLNSKLINYFYKFTSTNTNITNSEILRIPIPKMNQVLQNKIGKLVDKILTLKAENAKSDTSTFEKQIDELVYQLYELSSEEKQIVEGIW